MEVDEKSVLPPSIQEALPDEDDGSEVVSAESPEGNMLGRLREKRRELREGDRHEDFNIPGYGGVLVARYKIVDWEVLRGVARKFDKNRNPKKELFAHCDTLIKGCIGLLISDEEGNLQPLDPDQDADPVTFQHTERLAQLLEFEAVPDTARGAVRALFPNDLTISAHHAEVTEWMEGGGDAADEEFVGKSESGRK